MLDQYYNSYWKKRSEQEVAPPIPGGLPVFLKKYTAYGAILNQIKKCDKLLDIGCGDGNVTQLYKKRAAQVHGIDISEIALAKAGEKGINVSMQDLNNLPLKFSDNFFDCVVLTDVIEHTINPTELLKEVKRILKPNGMAIITVPNFSRFSNRWRMFFLGDPIDILHWNKYGDEMEHLHWFTLPKLKFIMLKEVRFSKMKCVATGLKNLSFLFGLLGVFNFGSYLTIVVEK